MCDECIKCGRAATMMCQRCHESYCSQNCQIRDWREHKTVCIQMPCLIPNTKSTMSENMRRLEDLSCGDRPKFGSTVNSLVHSPITSDNGLNEQNLLVDLSQELKTKAAWETPFEPPKDVFFDVIIQYVENSSPLIAWITERKRDTSLHKLLYEINLNMRNNENMLKEVMIGSIVAAPLDNILYRAKVLSLNATKEAANVRLIDYGNEFVVPCAKLRASIPIMANTNAFAFRICLPKECGTLEVESVISIRLLGPKTPKDFYPVEMKCKPIEFKLPIEVLKKNAEVVLKKIFVGNQHALLQLSVHEKLNLNALINSQKDEDNNFNVIPPDGTFLAAKLENDWCRARLLGVWYNERPNFLVYFLDEGLIDFVQEIKRYPMSNPPIPLRIVMISTALKNETLNEFQLTNAKKLSLNILPSHGSSGNGKEEDALPCIVEIDNGNHFNVTLSIFSGEVQHLLVKYWTERIPNNSGIIITSVQTHAEIYISSVRTKNYSKVFSSMASECPCYRVDDTVSKGDLVLAALEAEKTYFRGEIISFEKDAGAKTIYQVLNIDRGTCHNIPKDELFKPNNFIRFCPVYLKKVKLIYMENIPTVIANNRAVATLKDFQKNAIEFKFEFTSKQCDIVDLFTKSGESLSKCLLPMLFENQSNDSIDMKKEEKVKCRVEESSLPPSPTNTPTVILSHEPMVTNNRSLKNFNLDKESTGAIPKIYTIDNLDEVPITLGANIRLYVLDCSNIAKEFISAAELASKDLIQKMSADLAKVSDYCKCKHTEKGYTPRANEICLAIFGADCEWYRAICLKVLDNDNFLVMFVDYGNLSKVSKKDILPIPKHLMFPTYANICYIEGLKGLKPNQISTLAENLMENPFINCKVSKTEDQSYSLKIHDLDKFVS